jgi:hypothetical protein
MESFMKHLSIDTVERDTTGGPETHRSGGRTRAAGPRRRTRAADPGGGFEVAPAAGEDGDG